MPLLTPSRLLLAVLSLSFFALLWSFGLPYADYPTSRRVIGHDLSTATPLADLLIPDQPSKPEGLKEDEQKPVLGPPEEETDVGGEKSKRPGSTGASTFCGEVRGAQDTMVIVKTSKAELAGKLPPHLETLLACVPHVAIFSDHAGTVGKYPVYDALEAVNATLREKHDEFREYAKMQADGSYTSSVDKAQKLDKWKYLPMVYKAYKMNPSLRYYLFIETDMTLSWTNLLQWLERLDYRIPYYSGAPMFRGDTKYAQRGSGILLSMGAMRLYAKTYDERYAQEWEPHIQGECCGDILLATAMAASHIEMAASWPILQGEAPGTLDWTERHWCTPIVSWHGVNAQETDMLWDSQVTWTKKNGWEVPYLARNAFEEFVLPQLAAKKEDWDNVSSDTVIKGEPGRREKLEKENEPEKTPGPSAETPRPQGAKLPQPARLARRGPLDKIGATIKDAADSAANCQTVCGKTEDCIQWKYSSAGDGECHMGKVLRLGRKTESKGNKDDWTSGWMLERVKHITEKWGKCEMPNWKFNQ
jgi:hypothetical protein